MIEDYHPDAEVAEEWLNEIDARFWCFLGVQGFDENRFRFDLTFDRMKNDKGDGYYYCNGRNNRKRAPKYTRCLTSCKAVMPEGWCVVDCYNNCIHKSWTIALWNPHNNKKVMAHELPTMELAWLHAITQAYIWEIENGG